MPRKPFNMLAACFYLLAGVIAAQIGATIFAGVACYRLNMISAQEVGACMPVAELIRSQWDKIFEAILALLIAGNVRPPSPD